MTKVEDVFLFYAMALTNWLYTLKQFQGKSRRKSDAGFVAYVIINAYTLVVGNLAETVLLEGTQVDGQ